MRKKIDTLKTSAHIMSSSYYVHPCSNCLVPIEALGRLMGVEMEVAKSRNDRVALHRQSVVYLIGLIKNCHFGCASIVSDNTFRLTSL